MRPLTDNCPKPLLPLIAEPLVAYQLRRLARVGVRRVVLATGYLATDFVDVLGDGSSFGVELCFSVEQQPLGTGGAIRAAVDRLPGADRVVVLNGDLLSSHDLAAQLASARGTDVCLHVRPVPDVASYGQVTCGEGGRVTAFAEKTGRGRGLANAGSYVIAADVVRSLPAGCTSWERDGLPALIASGADVVGWQGDGYFRDVGSPEAYRRACVDAVTARLPDVPVHEGGVYVARGAQISPDAQITAGSSVQQGAVVGPGAVVRESIVLAGARIDAGARVSRCVVAEDAVARGDMVHEDVVIAAMPTRR